MTGSRRQIGELFVSILVFSRPCDPADLWRVIDGTEVEAHDIDRMLQEYGMNWGDIPGLPPLPIVRNGQNALIQEELAIEVEEAMESLNEEQNEVVMRIMAAVEDPQTNPTGNMFFVNGAGGTGKTYVYNSLSSSIRRAGGIVLNVASSGIASLLLPGGRTAHSRFRIPLNLSENSTCSISARSPLAELMGAAQLIIWDEAPMCHRFAFEALDRTLQDVLQDPRPMGGKPFVLGGDFRQILPVVRNGSPAQIVAGSIRRSPLWRDVAKLHLTTNMRVGEDELEFANWLLST